MSASTPIRIDSSDDEDSPRSPLPPANKTIFRFRRLERKDDNSLKKQVRSYWKQFLGVHCPLVELPGHLVIGLMVENSFDAELDTIRFLVNRWNGFNFPRIDGFTPFFPGDVIDRCGIVGEAEVVRYASDAEQQQ